MEKCLKSLDAWISCPHCLLQMFDLSSLMLDAANVNLVIHDVSFLCLKNENIVERVFAQPEGIHLPTKIGIRNFVTIGIVPACNPDNH